MVRAILSSQFDYVLREERDLPQSEQTVFHLRRLTSRERWNLDDDLGTVGAQGDFAPRIGRMTERTLQAGLEGWTNFLDEQGSPVEFRKSTKMLNVLGKNVNPPEPEMFDMLGSAHLSELGEAIRDGVTITQDDAGN